MDRIIAPYGMSHTGGLAAPTLGPAPMGVAALPAKTGRDYLRALKRRWWLAFTVALFVIVVGVMVVLRLHSYYQAVAEIKLVPPSFDPALSVIVDSAANLNRDNTEQFVLDRIAELRSKSLIDRVVRDHVDPNDQAGATRLVSELSNSLTTKRIPGTNTFHVTLESRDQDRVAKILNGLLNQFVGAAKQESRGTIDESIREANRSLERLSNGVEKIDGEIQEIVQKTPEFAPNGQNLVEEEFLELKSVLLQKRVRLEDLMYERRIADLWPNLRDQAVARGPLEEQMSELAVAAKQIEQQLDYIQHTARSYRSDPLWRILSDRMSDINAEMDRLRRMTGKMRPPDLAAMHISRAAEEIRQLEEAVADHKVRLQETAPHFQEYLGRLKRREELENLIAQTEERKLKFESVAGTLTAPVVVNQRASDPVAPSRPNRVLGIALVSVVGLGLGLGLVILLEGIDRAVKAPNQLTEGTALPLLGVVPRIRRMARICRGGHLWTAAAPQSIESDAFRNLRASLVGIERPDRPNVTLLVTSAKAGEGKSTIALNLAAAFARSGERTLLVDCDLRNPGLGAVFGVDSSVGLVDVLRGEMPWQRALVSAEGMPNLSFLPAGHLGGLPIEILGSLELRQLVIGLARSYHRVILDGPAVVGMAEGRLLANMADATMLVVRSGSHELGVLRMAREMLLQSKAAIAGAVFNDLSEDLQHWSSVGSLSGPRSGVEEREPRRSVAPRRLGAQI